MTVAVPAKALTTLSLASRIETVTVCCAPATTLVGSEVVVTFVAAPGFTIAESTACPSVPWLTVTVCAVGDAVFRVTEKVLLPPAPAPMVSEVGEKVAAASDEVSEIVPEAPPVATFWKAS